MNGYSQTQLATMRVVFTQMADKVAEDGHTRLAEAMRHFLYGEAKDFDLTEEEVLSVPAIASARDKIWSRGWVAIEKIVNDMQRTNKIGSRKSIINDSQPFSTLSISEPTSLLSQFSHIVGSSTLKASGFIEANVEREGYTLIGSIDFEIKDYYNFDLKGDFFTDLFRQAPVRLLSSIASPYKLNFDNIEAMVSAGMAQNFLTVARWKETRDYFKL